MFGVITQMFPDYLRINEEIELTEISASDSLPLYKIIQSDPQIAKFVTWASYIRSASDVVPTLFNHSGGHKMNNGRYTIRFKSEIKGYMGIFPRTCSVNSTEYFLQSIIKIAS